MKQLNQILYLADAVNPFSWVQMPGTSHAGPEKELTDMQSLRKDGLQKHVTTLASTIGERHYLKYQALQDAGDYISQTLRDFGYNVRCQEYKMEGRIYRNFEAELPGSRIPEEIIVAGAHYDSVQHCPGANDNATGIAAVLELAKTMARHPADRTVRFVAFTNEEDPHFGTEYMGSQVYASNCYKNEDKLIGMFALETMGYFSDEKGTQKYPIPVAGFYPDTGNFIVFVGNTRYKGFVHKCISHFRASAPLPSEGVAVPGFITGVSWSDHMPFWQHGFPAVMITDTALYRYPHYHTPEDTPDKVNFSKLTQVTCGVESIIEMIADE
jgi:hypothetical protein